MSEYELRKELVKHILLKDKLLAAYPELRDDDPALFDTLDGATDLRGQIAAIIESSEQDGSLIDALANRINELSSRLSRIKGRYQKKRETVAYAMEEAGIKKLELPECTLSMVASKPAVVITDENLIPPAFMKHPPPVPNKTAIGNALKSGDIVLGCTLSNQPPHLQVRRS